MPLIAIAAATNPKVRKQIMRIDWLWLLIGIALALFVFPMLTGLWAARGSQTNN